MKNVVFWEIKIQFVRHRRHIASPQQIPASKCFIRVEVYTALTMKNAVFWDINTQFVPNRGNITAPLQSLAG
jgi:hypothetical protein